jgi:hypothetical protein
MEFGKGVVAHGIDLNLMICDIEERTGRQDKPFSI